MAKHWSADVFILCWSDPQSDGRMRMSWGTRERCEDLASVMSSDHDAVLYNGFGRRVPIRETQKPVAKLPKTGAQRKQKAKTSKSEGHPAG